MDKLNLFFKLTKIDEAKRTVEGIATADAVDLSGEICDYETTKPYYEKWSAAVSKASGGKSLGNVREMHSNIAAGKIIEIVFDDVAKAIRIVTKCVDDSTWNKIVEGVLTGFSQGGEYVQKWKDKATGKMRYTADPSEVSYVDMPCLPLGVFEVVKADGSIEMRKFQTKESPMTVEQVWKAQDGSTHLTKREAEKHNAQIAADAEAAELAKGAKDAVAGAKDTLDKIPAPEPTDAEIRAEKLAKVAALAKEGTYDVMTALDALCAIEWLYAHEVSEALTGEDDDKSQVEDLKTVIERLKAFIASEVTEDLGDDGALERMIGATIMKGTKMHKEHAAMVGEIHKGAMGIMQHVQKCIGGVKKADHHTAADHEHVEKIHGAAVDIADKCMKMVGGDMKQPLEPEHQGHVHDMHKSATNVMDACHKFMKGADMVGKADHHDEHDVAQLHKMHGHAMDIAEKCVKMFGENKPADGNMDDNKGDGVKPGSKDQTEKEPVEKLMKAEALNTALTKALGEVQGTVDALLKRIDRLERQPAERKGKVFVAKRGDEVEPGSEPDDAAITTPTSLTAMRLSPEDMRKAAGF